VSGDKSDKSKILGVVLVNLATISWGTNAILGRWLRDDIGPLTLTTVRFTVAALFFTLLFVRLPPFERSIRRDRGWIIAMALCGIVVFSPMFYLGLRYSTAVNSSLIQGFSPLFTALIAGWIIQEAVTPKQVAGAVLGLIGVIGLISGGSLTFLLGLRFNPGDVCFLAAAVLWSFYSVFGRRVMRRRSPVAATTLCIYIALPLLFVAAAFELRHIPPNLSLRTLAAILHISFVPTVLAFWCWNRAVQTLGAHGAMAFYNTLPLYGALMGVFFLGEPLGTAHFIFGGLIIAGGVLASFSRRRK
jgi:drug/metabolite transporter (DMT)-like permease